MHFFSVLNGLFVVARESSRLRQILCILAMKSKGYRFGYLYTPFSTLTSSFHRLHFSLKTRGGGGKTYRFQYEYKGACDASLSFEI